MYISSPICVPDSPKSSPKISEIFTKSIFSFTCVIQPHRFHLTLLQCYQRCLHSLSHAFYPVALYLSWDECGVYVWHNLSSLQEAIMCVRPTQASFRRNSPEPLMHTGQSSPEPIERGPRGCCVSVSALLNTGCARLPDLSDGADSDLREKGRWTPRREFLALSPFSFPARGHFWYGN